MSDNTVVWPCMLLRLPRAMCGADAARAAVPGSQLSSQCARRPWVTSSPHFATARPVLTAPLSYQTLPVLCRLRQGHTGHPGTTVRYLPTRAVCHVWYDLTA
eukprot:2077802-Rhodomonas_salina.1